MKAIEIVSQLSTALPQLTDKFTDDVAISSLTRAGTEITVSCSQKHLLNVGQAFALIGSDVPIVATITRAGAVGTLVTATNHDLTRSQDSIGTIIGAQTIRLTGSVETEFNGTFTTLSVVNRKTITFTMIDSGPTTATGSPVLRDAESALRSYNATYEVKEVLNPTEFIFVHSETGLAVPVAASLRVNPRITSGVTIERCVAAYTRESFNKYWGFVVLGGVNASQSRLIESDATDNQQRNANFRQQILQPFTLFIVAPAASEVAARAVRDEISDLFRPILRSLLFRKFDTGLYADFLNPLQFTGHDIHSYDTGLYVHSFSFEQVAEIYEQDTVGPDIDVAFRDIDFKVFLDFGTQVNFMQSIPDLDGIPL